jgi:pimeloyl-ACP methyl ester carboxylesterase
VKWVAVGHSQGGQAALGVGELSAERLGAGNYLGTVAIAPAANLELAPEQFHPSDVLAPELAELRDFPQLEHALTEHWSDSAAVLDFLKTNEPAQVPSAAPILLLQGSEDEPVPRCRHRSCATALARWAIRSVIVNTPATLTIRS